MKPRHTAEQSTVKVNKSEELGSGAPRKGFGAATAAPVTTAAATAPAEAAPAAAPRRGFGFGGLAPKSGE